MNYKFQYIKELKTQIKVHRLLLIRYSDYCIFCEEIAGYMDSETKSFECECILDIKEKLKSLRSC